MRTIVIVPYDDKWPEMFEAESVLVKTLLGGVVKSIYHIGSTSVPGLSAKPVIDIPSTLYFPFTSAAFSAPASPPPR